MPTAAELYNQCFTPVGFSGTRALNSEAVIALIEKVIRSEERCIKLTSDLVALKGAVDKLQAAASTPVSTKPVYPLSQLSNEEKVARFDVIHKTCLESFQRYVDGKPDDDDEHYVFECAWEQCLSNGDHEAFWKFVVARDTHG